MDNSHLTRKQQEFFSFIVDYTVMQNEPILLFFEDAEDIVADFDQAIEKI